MDEHASLWLEPFYSFAGGFFIGIGVGEQVQAEQYITTESHHDGAQSNNVIFLRIES
jgi:hypothetical protein